MTKEDHGRMLLESVPSEARARLTGRQVEAILDGRSWAEKNPGFMKFIGVVAVVEIVLVVGLAWLGVGT